MDKKKCNNNRCHIEKKLYVEVEFGEEDIEDCIEKVIINSAETIKRAICNLKST